jgi:hypothetical protein
MIWKTKVKWFSDGSKPKTSWTHTYKNSLGNVVRCYIVSSDGPSITIMNENGCALYKMRMGDLFEI